MKIRSFTKVAGFVVFGFAGASSANAQTSSPAAGCFVEPARLSNADIGAFLSAPQSLLTQFASGGLPLSNQVRALAGSSSDALAALIGLSANANPNQAAAIGAGLARAARACATVNPEYASQIQDAVAATGNQALETAFLAGGTETQTAALGGLAAGGSPTGGGGAIGGGGTPGGGANGSLGESTSVGAGTSSFSAGGGSSYFADSGSSTTTVREVSATTP